MSLLKFRVSKTLQGKIRRGHPWVFAYQILEQAGTGRAGDLGVIYGSGNQFLALGLYDPHSELRLRILQTSAPAEIGQEFFRRRLQKAYSLRSPLENGETTGYRIVNGENDGFPGLVLDRYADTAVLKLYTAAWVPHLSVLILLLQQELPLARAILRVSRNLERMPQELGGFQNGHPLFGSPPQGPVRFEENGLWFTADVLAGQKTGFFLDQRDNRQHIRELAKGKTVLNVFSYSGGFSVYARAGGSRSVLEIDSNPHALTAARTHWEMNFAPEDASALQQTQGDAFEELEKIKRSGQSFDVVILDPPAFANNKKQKDVALRAYSRLSALGASVTCSGGILYAASCSAHVSKEEFFQAVGKGIRSSGAQAAEIRKTGHALDHPVGFPEGEYLKGIYLRISDSGFKARD